MLYCGGPSINEVIKIHRVGGMEGGPALNVALVMKSPGEIDGTLLYFMCFTKDCFILSRKKVTGIIVTVR